MSEVKRCENCGNEQIQILNYKGDYLCGICGRDTERMHEIEHDAEVRAKAIDEVMEVVKRVYHNFSGYDLEQMTKYGNKNARQQSESYSTLMMYEIAGEFGDLIDELEQMKGCAIDG